MKIEAQSDTFEHVDVKANSFEYCEADEQKFSSHQSFQQLQNQPIKRSRNEMEQFSAVQNFIKLEEVKLEDIIFLDDEEELNDDEDVKFPQQASQIQIGDVIHYCGTCSLDFPSMAYLKRHQKTKKHQRALKMEQRGRKVNLKRRYVRRNEVRPENIQIRKDASSYINQGCQSITDLTSEEIALLHKFDNQMRQIESKNTTKDFYENFKEDLDIEIIEPAPKVRKLSSKEEIMADIIANCDLLLKKPQTTLIPKIEAVQEKQQNRNSTDHVPIIIVKTFTDKNPNSKIQCQMCPKTFNLRWHYTQHMNSIHSEERKFRCQKCGKRFPQQELLEKHIMKHFGNKPFKCSKCEKSYHNKIDQKRHEKSHEDVRDHVCKVCGFGFIRFDHLQNHLLTHIRQRYE